MLVFLNANNPSESAIDAGFNKVSLKAVLEEFCDEQTLSKIPNDIRNTILNVSMEDVRLTVAARPITVMNKDFDPGFRIKGTAAIGDIAGANLDVQVGYEGIDASAGIKKISHPPFFELKGARGKEDPTIQIVAKADKESKVMVSGSATLLGLTAEADMLLNDKGFDLYARGKIFDAFEAKLEVSGSRVTDGGSFRVAATMEQNFMAYVTENASKEIDKATKDTQEDISYAQGEITKEQNKLKVLEVEINKQKKIVQGERDRDLANIRTAKADVERERLKVQKIQNDINSAHSAIATAKKKISQIKVKPRKIDSAESFFGAVGDAVVQTVESTPEFAKQSAIITAKGTEIAALETAKETADLALTATRETLGLMNDIGDKVPIEMDPRVAGLIASKETANAAMETAKGVLEAAKVVGVGSLSAAKWIVENGPQNVVNITYAHFETKLSAAHGGSITVHFKGTFAGEPMDEKFTINFENPLDSVQDFAESLI